MDAATVQSQLKGTNVPSLKETSVIAPSLHPTGIAESMLESWMGLGHKLPMAEIKALFHRNC